MHRMIARIIMLGACILIPAVLSEYNNDFEIGSNVVDKDHIALSYVDNNEDIRFIQNLIDAYRSINPRLATNLEAPRDQAGEYQVGKRNADIINTLLGFPRRMFEAGR